MTRKLSRTTAGNFHLLTTHSIAQKTLQKNSTPFEKPTLLSKTTQKPDTVMSPETKTKADALQASILDSLLLSMQDYPTMDAKDRKDLIASCNRSLSSVTVGRSVVEHQHTHETTPNLAGLGPSNSSLARPGDEVVAAQERGGPRPENFRA